MAVKSLFLLFFLSSFSLITASAGGSTSLPPAAAASRSSGPKWWLISPLAFTALPLIRHFLKDSPPHVRHWAYGTAVSVGLLHGFVTMLSASGTDEAPEEAYFSPAQLARRGKSGER